jgi:dihydrofolate reductase
MRNVILWNLVTLDGYFEGAKSWEIDWHDYVWGEELERFAIEQSKTTDTLLFGRVTYEGMAAYWPSQKGEIADFMNRVPKIVFSQTLKKADWSNTRLVRGDAAKEVARLKRQPGGSLTIFGSAKLASALTQHGLIDEYQLGLTPVLLGRGTPLFKPSPDRVRLRLVEARPLTSGCVILRYRREPTGRGPVEDRVVG